MEIKTARLKKKLAHNENLWKCYHNEGNARGDLVLSILSEHIDINQSRILDVGCGSGAISRTLARYGAEVKAIDITSQPFSHTFKNIHYECTMAETLNELPDLYDAVILADVLEHLKNPVTAMKKLYISLKKNGLIYLSTPNKYSFINILNDPHYSLPIIGLCRRRMIKKIIHHSLRWTSDQKSDYAELFSYRQLAGLLETTGFSWKFINRQIVRRAFQYPQCVWNRSWHLRSVEMLKKIHCREIVLKIINDKPLLFNRLVNPTWYILACKR